MGRRSVRSQLPNPWAGLPSRQGAHLALQQKPAHGRERSAGAALQVLPQACGCASTLGKGGTLCKGPRTGCMATGPSCTGKEFPGPIRLLLFPRRKQDKEHGLFSPLPNPDLHNLHKTPPCQTGILSPGETEHKATQTKCQRMFVSLFPQKDTSHLFIRK